jgi:hypothetical protein
VEKYGTARQAVDDYIIWRMRLACWVNEATDTHSEYVIFLVLPLQQWFSRLCLNITFTRTFPVLLIYHVDIWLHVATTSGHPQAVKIYRTEITIITPIVGCPMFGATYVPSVSFILTA